MSAARGNALMRWLDLPGHGFFIVAGAFGARGDLLVAAALILAGTVCCGLSHDATREGA